MKLRDYQLDACMKALSVWQERDARILLTLATGLGKTIIFANLAQHHVRGAGTRVLVIAPSIELVGQAADKIQAVTGESVAIEQAENWSNEELSTRADYIVSCKASLVSGMRDGRKRFERLRDIGLIVIDEAHGAATTDYQEIIEHFNCRVLGVTATPRRHDKVRLGEIFDEAPFVMGIKEGVDRGWLVAPKTTCLQLESLDLSKVGTNRSGDFVASQLGRAMEDDAVVFEIAEAVAQESGGMKTLVFTASVDHAFRVATVLQQKGLRADWVCGDKARCPDAKRSEVLRSFTRDPNGLQFMVNCGVLTTGFDFPGLAHIVNARPTKSEVLFTQILGRGTRALPGVVDFEGSTPETRRAAIAASGKPSWKFTDLRDTSMQHKLITPVDVLGGDFPIEVREKAQQLVNESEEPREVGEVLEEAAELLRQQEEAEKARLRQLKAQASYQRVDVDPFDAAFNITHAPAATKRRGARMPFGKFKGELVEDIDRSYLAYMMRSNYIKADWLKKAVNQRLGVIAE